VLWVRAFANLTGIKVTTEKTELGIAGQSFETLEKANEHGAE